VSQIEDVDVTRAQQLLAEGAMLLDVREDDEYVAGHAPEARHVPLSSVPDEVDSLDRDRIIVCVCRSGGRSARAGHFLLEQGFHAVNLEGGMTAWHAAGAPMIAEEGEPYVA